MHVIIYDFTILIDGAVKLKSSCIYIFFILSSTALSCTYLLPGNVSLYLYWLSIFALITTISLLIFCIVVSKLNPHIIVTIQEVLNVLGMLIVAITIISMYYIYGYNYPLLRSSRSTHVACIIHSFLTTVMVLLPSTSLLLLTIIHYRAVFWTKYDSKLSIKNVLVPILLIWFITIALSTLWTSFHEQYNEWYCLPFSRSLFSILLQSAISTLHLTCFLLFIKYYTELLLSVHKEELKVMAMRSKKFSHTRMLLIRFIITIFLHITQLVLMNLMLWLPLFDISDATMAMIYVAYIYTVACSDIYLHTYIILKNRYLDFRSKKTKTP